jgi:tetrahydromethanopterin S-methyltransferase subunit G
MNLGREQNQCPECGEFGLHDCTALRVRLDPGKVMFRAGQRLGLAQGRMEGLLWGIPMGLVLGLIVYLIARMVS